MLVPNSTHIEHCLYYYKHTSHQCKYSTPPIRYKFTESLVQIHTHQYNGYTITRIRINPTKWENLERKREHSLKCGKHSKNSELQNSK